MKSNRKILIEIPKNRCNIKSFTLKVLLYSKSESNINVKNHIEDASFD